VHDQQYPRNIPILNPYLLLGGQESIWFPHTFPTFTTWQSGKDWSSHYILLPLTTDTYKRTIQSLAQSTVTAIPHRIKIYRTKHFLLHIYRHHAAGNTFPMLKILSLATTNKHYFTSSHCI